MYIAYLVTAANVSEAAGGTRVILEHVNRLLRRGHKVEIWAMEDGIKLAFECLAPLKKVSENLLSDPDVLVMTDISLSPAVHTNRKKHGTFLWLQHDNEWVAEMNGVQSFFEFGLSLEKQRFMKGGRNNIEIIVVSSWLHDRVREKYGFSSHVIPNGI